MKTNIVKAFIERGSDGTYGVYVDLEDNTLNYGIHGDGETVEDAIDDFNQSYFDMKDIHQEKGEPFVEAEFVFNYDLVSFLQYYSKYFSYAAMSRITGVNETQLSQYVQGYRNPSTKTAKKIEERIHEFAKELSQVQFV